MKFIVKSTFIVISYLLIMGSVMSQEVPEAMANGKDATLSDILNRIENKYKALDAPQIIKPISVEPRNTQLVSNQSSPINTVNMQSQLNLADETHALDSGIPEGEELLLSVFIDKLYLADVIGYKSSRGAKISLQNLFEVLDFPIAVDMAAGQASGWFINEDQKFKLDFSPNTSFSSSASLTINGQASAIPADAFFISDQQLYVEGSQLSKWFGLNIAYQFSDLKIILSPIEPLPIQLRLARENKAVVSRKANLATMPWKESSYQMLSSPLVDLQILHSNNNKNTSGFTNFSALGSHDLAYMNTEYFIAGRSEGGLSDARLKFSKETPKGLLGFLPEAYIEIGDINNVSINSDFKGGLNRGVSVSKKQSEVNNNQRININGDIQPGWDIEIYQNNILVAKQTSVQSGRYEFNNIDLFFGDNNFEIVSYGPQGQVKREFKEIYINTNALGKFEEDYAFSITQVGKSLLGVNNELTSKEEGILFSGSYGLGLSDWLSLSLGQSSLLNDNGDNQFNYSVGSNVSLFERLLINANININQDSDLFTYLTARSLLFGQSLFYSYSDQQYQEIDATGESKKLSDKIHTFRMSGSLFEADQYRLNYNNLLYLRNNPNGFDTTRVQNQLALSAGRFSIQHSLDWQSLSSPGISEESLTGFVQMQRNLGPVFSRLTLGYSVQPESELDFVTTQFSWAMFTNIQTDLELNYIPDTETYKTKLAVNWQSENFSLTSNVTYDSNDEWILGVFLRFAFGYDIDKNNSFIDPFALARNGAMAVRVFEDINNDGLYQEDEPTVQDVKIRATQSQRQANTDDNGIAYVTNLRNHQKTDIEIDTSTLGDPFLIPSTPGVSITPRKGFLEQIDYPVVTSSEIDGTIYVVDLKGNERSLGYVPINLLNEQGDIVASTQSEYDGYYLFVDLIPGKYFVSVPKEYLKKRKLDDADDLDINLTVQGDVINGSDFVLSELEFTKGFVVSAGNFDNLSMLKVYWHLIQKRYRAKLKQTVFYSFNEELSKHQLNLGFFRERDEAVAACDLVMSVDIDCKAEAFEFVDRTKDK